MAGKTVRKTVKMFKLMWSDNQIKHKHIEVVDTSGESVRCISRSAMKGKSNLLSEFQPWGNIPQQVHPIMSTSLTRHQKLHTLWNDRSSLLASQDQSFPQIFHTLDPFTHLVLVAHASTSEFAKKLTHLGLVIFLPIYDFSHDS